eukprot:3698554-Prymnesium_polylepis.1
MERDASRPFSPLAPSPPADFASAGDRAALPRFDIGSSPHLVLERLRRESCVTASRATLATPTTIREIETKGSCVRVSLQELCAARTCQLLATPSASGPLVKDLFGANGMLGADLSSFVARGASRVEGLAAPIGRRHAVHVLPQFGSPSGHGAHPE